MQINVASIKSFFGRSTPGAANQGASLADTAKALAKAVPAAGDLMHRLPLIGQLSVARRFQMLFVALGVFLIIAAICVIINNRAASQSAVYVSTATEMQMLSQRIANSAQQAAQGSQVGFDQLQQSRDRFISDFELLSKGGERLGVSVSPSSGAIQPTLQDLEKIWQPVQTNINLILAQKQNLLDLRKLENIIEKAAPQLSLLTQELLVTAADAGEAYRVVTYARQLNADVANFDFINAVRLLSTDNPNPQVALQLGSNTRQYQSTLNALLGQAKDASVGTISTDAAKRKAAELNKVFAPFASSVQAILTNMQALAKAKQASRDIFAASENMLKLPVQLTQTYQQESQRSVYYTTGAVLSALLAIGCLVLLGKMFLDDARRRALQSEQENKRNQEAILRLLDEMGKVADGDLTVQAKVTEDVTGAIADSINYTIEELRRLVTGITKASTQVGAATSAAQRITSQLLQAAQKQSAEIQVTSQSVLQMAQSINEVSNNATQSAQVARSSLGAAEKGTQAVQNAIRGMNDIREQIQETSKRIKRLGESSQEIGEIVQLISDITEQTNVLALNAAIQAASAGEAGRGFTVVAEEVQRLAERSAEATKHISAIVKSIQSDTQDAVGAMERSTQGVVGGTKVADEAGQALHEIERISKELASLIGSISNATQEQAESATKVAANMKAILSITQLTTDGTKKTAAATAQLEALSSELKNSVSGFKVA
jgi:twitching motility protein PilJ